MFNPGKGSLLTCLARGTIEPIDCFGCVVEWLDAVSQALTKSRIFGMAGSSDEPAAPMASADPGKPRGPMTPSSMLPRRPSPLPEASE